MLAKTAEKHMIVIGFESVSKKVLEKLFKCPGATSDFSLVMFDSCAGEFSD